MITIKIVRDWKKRFKANEDAPLDMRITINRKSYYLATGLRVKADELAGGYVVGRPDCDEMNELLGMMTKKAYAELKECLDDGRNISMLDMKRKLWAVQDEKADVATFMEWVHDQIPHLRLADGTMKHYRTVEKRLNEFGKFRKWSDITIEYIYMWDSFVHGLKKEGKDEFISDATTYVYHKCLKALLNRAVEFGKLDRNPYDRLKGRFKRGEKESVEYMTEEQMKMVVDLHPLDGTQMAKVRDLFVFQMFTGLAYSDAQAFDVKNYHQDGEVYVANGQRIKTGVPYISVLLPPVVDVLERNNWKVPKISNQKYNALLKTMGAMLGIEGMHSHLARHTFATYMLANESKVQNVMRMLGHKNIAQTMRYAKVLVQDVRKDFDNVSCKFNNGKK